MLPNRFGLSDIHNVRKALTGRSTEGITDDQNRSGRESGRENEPSKEGRGAILGGSNSRHPSRFEKWREGIIDRFGHFYGRGQESPHGTEPQDGRASGRSRKESPKIQGGEGTQGIAALIF